MEGAPRDDRINARAQLEHVARELYADPHAALRAMRLDMQREGAETVRLRLETDFTRYGVAHPRVRGPSRERAQIALRADGIAADMKRWLLLDHTPSQLFSDREIERALRAPDAESMGHASAGSARSPDPRERLTEEERLAYDHLEAYAEAKERADLRLAAEARLHDIYDHRANLTAAEENLPRARAALRSEVEGTYRESARAMARIEAALARSGPAETARQVRSGELLKREQQPIHGKSRKLGLFPVRDDMAEAAARERVAKRIETIGYYEGDLGKFSGFQPYDGPAVQGVKNVRAALDREEAHIVATSGIGRSRRQVERNLPVPPHPAHEASMRGRVAQQHLSTLPSHSRERVFNAARNSGIDRMGAAVGHLQAIQTVARSLRDGIEGPGH